MRMELVWEVTGMLLAGIVVCGSLIYAFGRSSRGHSCHGPSKG